MGLGKSSKTYVALFKSIHNERKRRVSITCTISQLPRNTGYSSIHHLIFYVNNTTSIKEFIDKCKTFKILKVISFFLPAYVTYTINNYTGLS